MIVVGLTGGIGSGKSTVADLLAAQGAVVIDADRIAREVVEPSGPAYAGVVEYFGPDIVLPDGYLDRPGLARIAFNDAEALASLNRLTHPFIAQVMAERMAAQAGTESVVVLDIPLLAEGGRDRYDLAAVIVVDAEVDVALDRLVQHRHLDPADARARMSNQVSREERVAMADIVIPNSGTLRELEAHVEAAWEAISALASAPTPSGSLSLGSAPTPSGSLSLGSAPTPSGSL
ncbi:MAG: dephospho-CoA kinase, partial [Acidimicrobiales bacterium]